MPDLIQIDGSFGEGGGQIIRTSASLSAITGRAFQIVNVRAGRAKPGLQPQHLAAVRAAAELCRARVPGSSLGSTSFVFEPRSEVRAGEYRFDIGTAGAAALVAQTVLVPLALAQGESRVSITGGTHVPHAPTSDYLEAVYIPMLRRMAVEASCRTASAGFYPLGGGEIELKISGHSAPVPLELVERGRMQVLQALITTSGLDGHVAKRGAATLRRRARALKQPLAVEHLDRPSPGTNAAIILVSRWRGCVAGFSAVGARGKPIEAVAEEPCDELARWLDSGAACDEHLADQLVLPLCFAAGQSRWTTPVVTEHLRTVLWVAQQFLPIHFTIDEPDGGPPVVQMQGVGT